MDSKISLYGHADRLQEHVRNIQKLSNHCLEASLASDKALRERIADQSRLAERHHHVILKSKIESDCDAIAKLHAGIYAESAYQARQCMGEVISHLEKRKDASKSAV